MKIHIFCPLLETPSGGGNQFLKALCSELRNQESYAENPLEADAIIFNLSPFEIRDLSIELWKLKKQVPQTPIIARIDGPVYAYRGTVDGLWVDRACHHFTKHIADGVIFQSQWSKAEHQAMGYTSPARHTTIINAPNPNIFYPKENTHTNRNQIKIVATSWSANFKKGFDVYSWLDDNLDFSKYSFTFIGNSPICFKNIQHIKPLAPEELGKALRNHDVYLTASINDPCSNSLLEAIHSGLPVIAKASGGHPELLVNKELLFSSPEEIPTLLEKATTFTPSNFQITSIKQVANEYKSFIEEIYLSAKKTGSVRPCTFRRSLEASLIVRGPYSPQKISNFLLKKIKRFANKACSHET